MDLTFQVKSTIRALMDTNEYKELKKLKSNLRDKSFEKRVNDFKEIQFKMYQSQVSGKSMDSRKKAELTKRLEALSGEQGVSDYLKAEADFHNLLYRTYGTISESIETSLK